MAYTVTRTTSYGSRVSNSCGGTFFGIVLFALATVLLWWNEGRSVHRTQDIKEVGKTAQSVGDISSANASLDGQLIHATGNASTQDIISDDTFDLHTNAMSIMRTVEFYQWIEHKETETRDKLGGGEEEVTTYTYERGWSDSPINSHNFADPDYQDVNYVLWRIDDANRDAKNVTFGAYKLPEQFIDNLVSKMNDQKQALQLNPESPRWKEINDNMVKTNANGAKLTGDLPYIHLTGNQLYIGLNPSNPAVGDLRLTFEKLPASCDISLIAVPQNGTFTTYKAKHNDKEYELRIGTMTLDEMIQAAHDDNTMMTWLLRLAGVVLVIIALKMIFDIIVTLLKVLPFLSNIVGLGVGIVCMVIGLVWSLIVIAIAWIFYRPILGISLLVLAAALIYFFAAKGKDKLKDEGMNNPGSQNLQGGGQASGNQYNRVEKS